MLASNCQVPLTSVLLLFELTRDYLIILPTLATVGIRCVGCVCVCVCRRRRVCLRVCVVLFEEGRQRGELGRECCRVCLATLAAVGIACVGVDVDVGV